MKHKKSAKSSAAETENTLYSQLFSAQQDTENIAAHINFTNDPTILEDLIFKEKAAQIRFRYLLRAARADTEVGRDFSLLSRKT